MLFFPVAGYPRAAAPWGSTGSSVALRHLQPGSAGEVGSLMVLQIPEPLLEARLPSSPGSAAPVLVRGLALQGGCGRAPPMPG